MSLITKNEANAFCLPGGKIVVYTGILPLTRDDAGLATVLGHEVAHATAEHVAERIERNHLTEVAATIIAGGVAFTPGQFLRIQALLGVGSSLPFSRSQESEADHIGLVTWRGQATSRARHSRSGSAWRAQCKDASHVALITTTPDPYETTLGHGLGDVALAGLLVLVVWALAPRLRAARIPGPIQRLARVAYERWLTTHRLTGLFVAVAVLHGAVVDPVLHASTTLRAAYFVTGGTGLVAYAYRELLAARVFPTHDYTVAAIDRPSAGTITISLEPNGAPLVFAAGQFVAVAFGGAGRWRRHPFSVASAPSERRLQATVKAVGDYTRDLSQKL